MPAAQIETVVALARGSCLRSPIFKIAMGRRVDVLVVAQGGSCTVFESPPRRAIARFKFVRTSAFVSQVAGGKYASRDFFNELSGCSRTLRFLAARDIACT